MHVAESTLMNGKTTQPTVVLHLLIGPSHFPLAKIKMCGKYIPIAFINVILIFALQFHHLYYVNASFIYVHIRLVEGPVLTISISRTEKNLLILSGVSDLNMAAEIPSGDFMVRLECLLK